MPRQKLQRESQSCDPLWIHGGVGTIGGLPKSCKSRMGLDVAVWVASGKCLDILPFPGACCFTWPKTRPRSRKPDSSADSRFKTASYLLVIEA
jgi:hypothetical protein